MKNLLNQIETLTTVFLKDASSQLDKGNKAAGLALVVPPWSWSRCLNGSASCRWRLRPPARDKISIRMFRQGHSFIAASILLPFQIIGQFLCYPGIPVREHGDSLF